MFRYLPENVDHYVRADDGVVSVRKSNNKPRLAVVRRTFVRATEKFYSIFFFFNVRSS